MKPSQILLAMLLLGLMEAPANAADESGTLVMAARVNNAVIISVDSKVSGKGATIDATRKMFAVGTIGACAISGFLGTIDEDRAGNDLNVSSALREWVEQHPTTEALEGMPDLLNVVGEVWNRHGYLLDKLPNKRKPGSNITTLICGGVTKGEPWMIRGHIVVGEDGNASQPLLTVDDDRDLFNVGGIIPSAKCFYDIMSGYLHSENQNDDHLARIIDDLPPSVLKDKDSAASYNALVRAQKVAGSSVTKIAGSNIEKDWNLSSAQILFTSVFAAVENDAGDEVAPPNNAYILELCGRKFTTVEQKPWPKCTVHVSGRTPATK